MWYGLQKASYQIQYLGIVFFTELLKSENYLVSKDIRTVNYLWSPYKNFTLGAFQWLCGLLCWVHTTWLFSLEFRGFSRREELFVLVTEQLRFSQNSWGFRRPFGIIWSSQAHLEQVFQNSDQLGFEYGPFFKSYFCIIE